MSTLLFGWPYAGVGLAGLLLAWLAVEGRAAGATARWQDPAWVLPLLWPMYLAHQFEEHGVDLLGRHYAFLGDLCGVLGHAPPLISSPYTSGRSGATVPAGEVIAQQNLMIDPSSSPTAAPPTTTHYGPALAAATALFFMWGFLTCLNDILVPHLKVVFDLGYARGALVQLSFFSAYFLVSLPAGKIVAKVGYKRGILLGLLIAGAGALLFYPAASLPSYAFFLSALFVLASGIAFLQVAANPFVAVLGPKEGAPSRLNLTQAFNSLGTTLAPFFGSYFFFANGITRSKLAEAQAVRLPYVGLAFTLFLLAGAVALFKLPRISSAEGDPSDHSIRDALRVRHLALGVVAIFVYVGAEVSIGSFMVNFLEQPAIGGMDSVTAARHVSYYWGGAMVGRFAGSLVLRRVDAGRLLAVCAAAAASLVVIALLSTGALAMWSVLAVGLFNSIMFPTIFTLAIDGLGKLTSRGSSLLVMAIVGGAVIPVTFGLIADRFGLQRAFVLPALCYLYIVFYGLRGSRHAAARAA